MCLILLVLGVLGPRVAFIGTWIFSDRVQTAFSGGFVLPLLGVIFLPWTALAYVLCYAPGTGVSVLGWVIVVAGVLADILTYSGKAFEKRYQTR